MSTAGFTIDVGVPIPPRRGRPPKSEWTKWPFDDLEVGHSFFASGFSTSVHSAKNEYARLHLGRRFVTRFFESDPITKLPGTRVWRIR